MKRIAFLASPNYETTLAKCPDFINEFDLFEKEFARLGAKLERVHWRDANVDWKRFDRVIPKSCWDYSEHPEEFAAYLKRMREEQIPFQNDLEIVTWNMRKNYLLDLQARGLKVGELTLVAQGSQMDFEAVKKLFGDGMIVAKPSISGGARNTVRCQAQDLSKHREMLENVLKSCDVILQPFFPEVVDDGEYSIFFFGGQYSHALVKKPAAGDYRAHQLFGARNIKYEPTEREIDQAHSFVKAVPHACAYARVDVFRRSGDLYLMELELIEPYLYLELAPKISPTLFCEAILA
jgi:glutathione synthase/RimK-type ligase-like ATP-grasp enzyme